MVLYFIAIGGTGAQCTKALIHLASSGIFGSSLSIKILLVDPDKTNPSLKQVNSLIQTYQDLREFTRSRNNSWGSDIAFFQTSVELLDHLTSLEEGTDQSLGSSFYYDNYDSNIETYGIKHLFDALYSEQERKSSLDVGFRGRPAIGSAILSSLEGREYQESTKWHSFLRSLEAEIISSQKVHILLCGSIFGGSGAAGVPTLSRLIKNFCQRKFENEKLREKVHLGSILMLPYFKFLDSSGTKGIYAKAENFSLNTKLALSYYATQSYADKIYLLGIPDEERQEQLFSIGNETQNNKSHFLELYAALAAQNFVAQNNDRQLNENHQQIIYSISRKSSNSLEWDDLPTTKELSIKTEIMNTVKFALSWLNIVSSDLSQVENFSENKFHRFCPWFSEFYASNINKFWKRFIATSNLPKYDEKEQSTVDKIRDWAESYLSWIEELQNSCEGNKLFSGIFIPKNNIVAEESKYMSIESYKNAFNRLQFAKKADEKDAWQMMQEQLCDKSLACKKLKINPMELRGTHGLLILIYLLCAQQDN